MFYRWPYFPFNLFNAFVRSARRAAPCAARPHGSPLSTRGFGGPKASGGGQLKLRSTEAASTPHST